MSSPIMLIDDSVVLPCLSVAGKNNPILAFVMETPKQFVDFKFVKDYNIKEIYRVTGRECFTRKLAIHYGLNETLKTLKMSGDVPGFYDTGEPHEYFFCKNIYAPYLQYGKPSDKYVGYNVLPCPEYNNDFKNRDELQEYNNKILREVIKKYQNEYTVYIAY